MVLHLWPVNLMKTKIVIGSDYKDNVELQNFLESLPGIFPNEGKILYNKRNVIKSFDIVGVPFPVVVKRYKYPNIPQRFIYGFFRKSKARRAFENATELRRRGIDTPHEIAYIEHSNNGMAGYVFYISKFIDLPPIREKLIVPEVFDCKVAEDFASFAAELHEKGILHHDLNSTNVLYSYAGGNYSFSVIDINRMDFFPKNILPSQNDCFENLTRFTGRMDLYEYVLWHYLQKRGWDIPVFLPTALNIKINHDEKWKARKDFLRKFKKKK